MNVKKFLAVCAATLPVALVPTVALAVGTTVSVRVEGKASTLLPEKLIHTHGGWITRGGTPVGQCAATSAAGALDVATHHRWAGKYDGPGLGLEVDRVFKETHTFTSGFFWEIYVNNVAATTGACGIKPRRGEHLLFAAVPVTLTEFPLVQSAPRVTTAGHAFHVRVVYVNGSGKRVALSRARVSGGGTSALTNANGIATLVLAHAGRFALKATHAAVSATHTGYIRAASVHVRVKPAA